MERVSCANCGNEFEVALGQPAFTCPKCSTTLRRDVPAGRAAPKERTEENTHPEGPVAVLHYVLALIPAIVVAVLFVAAHQAMDKQNPQEGAAVGFYVAALVVGVLAIGGGIMVATLHRWPAALATLAGIPLAFLLVGWSHVYGGEGCNEWFNVNQTCNQQALIGGSVSLLILLVLVVAVAAAITLGLTGHATWSPTVMLGGGLAAVAALALASAIMLGQVQGDVPAAAAANQPHNVPSLQWLATLVAIVGAAALRRRASTINR
jgi:MYXO-CTERM domain-containing protein